RAFGQVSVDLFDGFLSGDLGFSLELKTANVKLDATHTLTGAKVTELSFTVSNLDVGVGGIGFHVTSGGLAIVTGKPSDPADHRSWLAVQADLENGTFTGVDGLDLTIHTLHVGLNRASGAGATPLNWKTAFDFEPYGTFGDVVKVTDAAGHDHTIEFTGDTALEASGTATVDLFGLVSGEIGFSFTTKTIDVKLAGGSTLVGAPLTTIGRTASDVF